MNFQPMKDYMDRLTAWKIPGNSISIYQDNKEIFSYCSGFSDLEKQERMTSEKQFYIYSCSKVATVTAAMQLYEKGCFLLDDPIDAYFPEYREILVAEKDGLVKPKQPITFRHLFTMTAGFSYDLSEEFRAEVAAISGGKMDNRSFAKALAKRPLCFHPGEHWGYSLCHDLLACLVEEISGMKFRDYMKKYLFDPLGMEHTGYHATPEMKKNSATQYCFVEDDTENDLVQLQKTDRTHAKGRVEPAGEENSFILGSEYDSGGAGIITTVPDYVKFASALANQGLGASGERILSVASIALMKQNQLSEKLLRDFNWPQFTGYGYGLGVRTMMDLAEGGSLAPIGEFGWNGAAGASVICDTQNRLALFYTHYMLNPQESYYQPRLRNVLYACMD